MPGPAQIAVVTDSFACFGAFPGDSAVTIAPNRLTLGGRTYHEGVDLMPDEAARLIAAQAYAPSIKPPSAADYALLYSQIAEHADAIVSIHASREISQNWANAKSGAAQVGHCPILVIDSRTLSAGQARLASLALSAAAQGLSLDSIAKLVRAAVDRVYCLFFVESMEYLYHNRILEPAHVVVGAMIGIKPLLTLENGRLSATEKVRSRSQAVERLAEFAVEFSETSEIVILHPRAHPSETGRSLKERLTAEFPERPIFNAAYGASLAALIGTDATGLVIYETAPELTAHD